jgi:hypothetical protein
LTGSESESLEKKAKTVGVVAVFRKGDLDEDEFMWTINRIFGIKTARERWKTFDNPEQSDSPRRVRADNAPPTIPDGSDPWA